MSIHRIIFGFVALNTALWLIACTSGSAQVDADVNSDAFVPIDAQAGCSVTSPCSNGHACCPVGQEQFCIDTDVDRNNCGECGSRCDLSNSDRCTDGACVCGTDPACPDNIDCCGGDGCATTNDSCGTCGNACASGLTCQDGQCVCQGQACGLDQVCCGDGCADLDGDDNNCGTCGNQCGDGESCQDGECVCLSAGYACAQGFSCCDGGCRNLDNNYDNCGACQFQCNEDTFCDSGVCDGNQQSQGPTATAATAISTGAFHSCARLNDQSIRCWGYGVNAQTGLGHRDTIGDDEFPNTASLVRTGEPLAQLTAGTNHTCGRTVAGKVLCWGQGYYGALGYGNRSDIGDDETPAAAGYVELGSSPATDIAAGGSHTCAAFADGSVRCWGTGTHGRLGYGNEDPIGDNELVTDAGAVDTGFAVASLALGTSHTCALSGVGTVRCWGVGLFGRLGYGNTNKIGDNETPASAGNVDIGGFAVQLVAGATHTCVLLSTGGVRCWGSASSGQLGYANTSNVGDDDVPASMNTVEIGGTAVQLAAGSAHTCALLTDGNIQCWGRNTDGQLGYGTTASIGDNETPASAGYVNLGGIATAISAGGQSTCALLTTGQIKCWGAGSLGQHGQGVSGNIGGNQPPAAYPPIQLF